MTEFAHPGGVDFRITPGPDGALWFTGPLNIAVGRITTSGVITEYRLPNTPVTHRSAVP